MASVLTKKRLTKDEKADKEILDLALERYHDCDAVCNEIYKDAMDDIKFSVGENQWTTQAMSDRQDRPCLVENRIAATIHQVCNNQRQNRPMIKVTPRNDGNDSVARVMNGLLRYIQYNSDSEIAFDTAFECAVRGGIGFYRLITDYVDDESRDQEILIMRIDDIQTVRIPIHLCRTVDFHDMPYCFVEATISKDDFEKEYPDADSEGFPSTGKFDGWFTDKEVRIAEYFDVKKEYYDLYLLSNGEISKEKPKEGSEITVENTRQCCKRIISWYKITGSEILERKTFPGQWIPVFPVIGEDVTIDGKRKFISLTHNAKDPQRMLNYWRSAEAEKIALAPKAPFVMYEGQDEGYEDEWANANRSNQPVLHAKRIVEGGNALPLPQRQQPTQMDMAIVNAARESVDAIKACTGIFDASLGAQGNETSGKAINARKIEGDTSNYHFFDNFAKSLRHCCRVIIDIIPEIIDTPRAIRILGEDMKQETIQVNQEYSVDGEIYDLTAGKYDVVTETGPSYMSKRQETADNLQQLAQSDPMIVQCARDLILKYLDLPAEVVERAQKTIPPQFLDDGKKLNPQMLQAALSQSQMQLQQLNQVLQQMQTENVNLKMQIGNKSGDQQTRLAIANLQAQVQLLINGQKITQEDKAMAHEVGLEAMRHDQSIEQGAIGFRQTAALQGQQQNFQQQQNEPQEGQQPDA